MTLAESAMSGNIGVRIRGDLGDRLDATLFGEAGARAVVSVSPDAAQLLYNLAQTHSVPCVEIGVVQGDRFIIDSVIDVSLADITKVWETVLPQAMNHHQ